MIGFVWPRRGGGRTNSLAIQKGATGFRSTSGPTLRRGDSTMKLALPAAALFALLSGCPGTPPPPANCGQFGQSCCTTGEACFGVAACNAANICALDAATGGLGQPCATMNGMPYCREGRCTNNICQNNTNCGVLNEACCTDGNTPCQGTGTVCFGGRCRTTQEVGCGGPGAICCQSANCASGLQCSENRCNTGDTAICEDLGNACSTPSACCGGAAACRSTEVNGADKCCSRAGQMARTQGECCGMLSFSSGTCNALQPGAPCLADSDCASRKCDGGTRTSVGRCCGEAGAMCTSSQECCGGAICGLSAGRNVCLLQVGAECRSASDCISGRCEGGRCTTSRLGERCRVGTEDCDSGTQCQGIGELGTCSQVGTTCTPIGNNCGTATQCCAGAFCDVELDKCVAVGSCLDLGRGCVPGGRECCGGLTCDSGLRACIRRPSPCKQVGEVCTFTDFGDDECCGTSFCDGFTGRCTAAPTCRSRGEACGGAISQPCCTGLTCNSGVCGTPTAGCREQDDSCNLAAPSDECCSGSFCYSLTSTCEDFSCQLMQQPCDSFTDCCGRYAPAVWCRPTFSSGGTNTVCCGGPGQRVNSSADCCGGLVRNATTQQCMKRNRGEPCLDDRDCNSNDCNETSRTCR